MKKSKIPQSAALLIVTDEGKVSVILPRDKTGAIIPCFQGAVVHGLAQRLAHDIPWRTDLYQWIKKSMHVEVKETIQ